MLFSDRWKGTLWELICIAARGTNSLMGWRNQCQVHDRVAHREDLRFVMKELHQRVICRCCFLTVHWGIRSIPMVFCQLCGPKCASRLHISSRELWNLDETKHGHTWPNMATHGQTWPNSYCTLYCRLVGLVGSAESAESRMFTAWSTRSSVTTIWIVETKGLVKCQTCQKKNMFSL